MQTLREDQYSQAANGEGEIHTHTSIEDARTRLASAIMAANRIVVDKPKQIRMTFACLLAGGHILIEDLPGTGKTVLARTMGAILGLSFQRIQFTSDLMPSDILGVSIYKQSQDQFDLHQGPIFTNLLLADEINRASPRTQSALLEAMAEGHVTIDRNSIALPQPFMVIATQNPRDMAGTFPLPEAQRDRFLFQIDMGYPDRKAEMALMRGERRNDMIDDVSPVLSGADILALRKMAMSTTVSDSLLSYAYDLVARTRNHTAIAVGLSPRGSIALLDAAKALAFIDGRAYAIPEDIQAAFIPLAGHRVRSSDGSTRNSDRALRDIMSETPM